MCIYFESNNKKDCNGCGACALRCPKKAIKMVEDKEGFLYPVVDEEKCINCGICKKVCSNNPMTNEFKIRVYAAKNKNEYQRANSTSGGIFKVLAEYTIAKKGVVFGVRYDEDLNVKHDYAETVEEIKEFSISKYVRSDLNDSYLKVEKFLEKNRIVLFTGTPCQCYGLKSYLKKDYNNLIICEIMCHSNPSPKVFKLYKKNIELDNNKKIKCYYFRSKNPKVNNRPYVEFKDGTILNYEIYNQVFDQMLISRPSCANCKFCNKNRKSDLTIGDFWQVEKFIPEIADKNGVSLLFINSKKGEQVFESMKEKIEYKETNFKDAFMHNHYENIPVHKKRDEFFEGISNGTINETNIIKYMKKYTKRPLYRRILGKIKRIIKHILGK